MQEQKKGYQFSTGFLVGLSSALIVAGSFGAWWAVSVIRDGQAPVWIQEQLGQKTQKTEKEEPAPVTTEELEAQVYWLKVTNNREQLVAQTISLDQSRRNPEAALEKALTQLMAGASSPEYASTIPPETELRNVSVREDGIYINLSEEFIFGGGSASMVGRLGQIVYTATSINPEAEVWLNIEGDPLEYLGGEGVKVPQPLTREKFNANYPLDN